MKYVVTWTTLFDLLLLTLALVPLVKQSIATYKATRRWEPNRYMSLVVNQVVAYLFANLLNNIPQAIFNGDDPYDPVWFLMFNFFFVITMFPLAPRFVISMRELFDKDSRRGRLQGVDNVFAISAHSGSVARRDHSVSGMAFTGGSSEPGEAQGADEIQLEVRGNDLGRVCSA